jgi:hypothetical protein
VRRNVRVTGFGEVAVGGAANETSVARALEPAPCLAGRGDLGWLLLLLLLLLRLSISAWPTSAAASMSASVASILEAAVAAISAVTTVAAITSVPTIATVSAVPPVAMWGMAGLCAIAARRPASRRSVVASRDLGGRLADRLLWWRRRRRRFYRLSSFGVRGCLGLRCRPGFSHRFDGLRSYATSRPLEIVAIRIIGGFATGPVGRTLATSATRWASTFSHANVG